MRVRDGVLTRAQQSFSAIQAVLAVVVAYRRGFHDAYDMRVSRLTDETRRERAARVFAAICAVAGFAIAWNKGALYYLTGGETWVEP